jgi:hypothetical protein
VTVPLTLRPAGAVDADPICLIYNQGIEDRVAALEAVLYAIMSSKLCPLFTMAQQLSLKADHQCRQELHGAFSLVEV